jgi:hypothetical protein
MAPSILRPVVKSLHIQREPLDQGLAHPEEHTLEVAELDLDHHQFPIFTDRRKRSLKKPSTISKVALSRSRRVMA